MSIDTPMNITPCLGTNGNDNLIGTGRSEVLSGAAGDDRIQGLSGHDEIFGGTGNDRIFGQAGNDIIYGNGQPTYVDMSNLKMVQSTTAIVTFVNEGAGFRNALGVYEIGKDGTMQDVQILFANASKAGSGGDLIAGESAVKFNVSAGTQLGFFIVPNGYGKGIQNRDALDSESGRFELRTASGELGSVDGRPVELWHVDDASGSEYRIVSQFDAATFHSAVSPENDFGLNPDNFQHVVGRASAVTGDLLIGFEDLFNGGDRDFDDTIINVHLGKANIVAQLPLGGSSKETKPDNDLLYGGDGDDEIHGVSGNDVIYGGRGNDDLSGNSGDDILHGNSGDDTLFGHSGNDKLIGGRGQDSLSGNSGDDSLYGGHGDDKASGGSGHDRIEGNGGDDKLSGNSGNDTILGGNGSDVINGNSGNDKLIGGFGSDVINGHTGDDALQGDSGCDHLIGGSGNDVLSGGEHNDRLYGGSGQDKLQGGVGNDYLNAGSGDDLVIGGSGNDKLFGGSGSDTFVMSDFLAGERDVIGDFKAEDTLDVSWFSLGSVDDLLAAGRQSGHNTIFTLDDGVRIQLNNYELVLAAADDFIV
ncbi:MAG: DUF4114 domain-containing protein [Ahrensia sp.]|nr:DUF4114 domain-containing protein [Ahrensia sp.]